MYSADGVDFIRVAIRDNGDPTTSATDYNYVTEIGVLNDNLADVLADTCSA